ncbi:MAG: S49 family peptidase [Parachlamydiales bacterium]|nr:S49 family peptidase [Parachlamydiales bacterium]
MEVIRESIFSSAVRSFVRGAFGVLGFFIVFIPVFFMIMNLGGEKDFHRKTTTEILPDLEGKTAPVPPTAPLILQIDFDGIIGAKLLDKENIQVQLLESQMGKLQGRIRGILLNMNTPGGAVYDNDAIYRLLMAYKEKYNVPVYVYVEGMCASGGMYIASAADKIYANPISLTGSVGVISGPYFNIFQTLEKIGVLSKTLTEGTGKDAMSPFRPWKEGEDKEYQAMIAYFYEQFVTIVSQGRNIPKKTIIEEYGAKVFTSPEAKEKGYIDEIVMTYNDALQALIEKANIDTKSPYQVITLKTKRKWIENLFQEKSPLLSGQIAHKIDLGSFPIESAYPIFYLYDPRH